MAAAAMQRLLPPAMQQMLLLGLQVPAPESFQTSQHTALPAHSPVVLLLAE
jgi:hypothetical protein